tara:strand:+ start:2798 stop:3370 length:573 start_codon:yes stop_codon:yes gene_type:complete
MKIFISVLVLIFTLQSLTKADDIGDFEIEGMSIGDSALEYFSDKVLNKNLISDYTNDKYVTSSISLGSDKEYEVVQLSYLKKDNKKIIVDINGIVDLEYTKCIERIKNLEKEFDNMFTDVKKLSMDTFEHTLDKSGKSKITDIVWQFNNGDVAILACYNWNPDYETGYPDEFRVAIGTKDFDYFLKYEAY